MISWSWAWARLTADEPTPPRSWRRGLNTDAAPVRGSRSMSGNPSGCRTPAMAGVASVIKIPIETITTHPIPKITGNMSFGSKEKI